MINHTICALSTAIGGAILIIRISGDNAIEITDKIFHPKGKSLKDSLTQTVHYGTIVDPENNVIDEVLVSIFRSPHSYTGENCVEISSHGSRYIAGKIIQILITCGCCQAEPGEFTQRAFLNGKMDLSQAEAVADLVSATNQATHKIAMSQLRGNFSDELSKLREQLLKMSSLLELELDFSDQNILFADRIQLYKLAKNIEEKISSLSKSFETGRAIKNGIPVAIIGKTNVGKSTLLNRLLHEDKAIVSEIHGTTRDVIEDTINLQGVSFRFIDTAGLRNTTNTIERLGIEKTYKKIEEAIIVLWVIDQQPTIEECRRITRYTKDKKLIIVQNKIDDRKLNRNDYTFLANNMQQDVKQIYISAKCNINVSKLENQIYILADLPEVSENDVIVTKLRHYDVLEKAHTSISQVLKGLDDDLSCDLLSEEIKNCINQLSEITEGISSDDTLHSIFSTFCIGK